VTHVVLGVVDVGATTVRYQDIDAELRDVHPSETVRVRFQLRNLGTAAGTVTPRLEYREAADPAFAVVPTEPVPGVPFHVDREWVPAAGGGSKLGDLQESIADTEFRISDRRTGETASSGHHAMAANPDRPLTLPPGGVTEEEFTLRISLDAPPSTKYQLRLTDAGTVLGLPHPAPTVSGTTPSGTTPSGTTTTPSATTAGAPAGTGLTIATVFTGAPQATALSPGQRAGRQVGPAGPPPSAPSPLRYALVAWTSSSPTVHTPATASSDGCGTCHGLHTGKGSKLLRQPGPESSLCFMCHDGTGAPQDVKSQYSNPDVPNNDPATGSYYRHDALATSTHTLASEDEFGGTSSRHSECGDCHNSHRAGSGPGKQTTQGWTASGRLAGISGVSVANGTAGTAPTYTFLDGTTTPVQFEYQLCLKCHSGFTRLASTSGVPPSRYALDKGVELNPANGSFHPVEGVGTNQTTAMANSLSGTSPYKLWNFTTASTIRCTHCHAGPSPATGSPPDADLAVHTSPNRGILLQPYRDRILKPSREAYAAADFALCYTCHAEAPFVGSGTTATDFRYHRKHVSGISGEGSGGTDIDTPGAGQGNALCAECHYRLHGSSSAYGSQKVSGTRLVNFAPDVTPNNGVLQWTSNGNGGSCTLVCHGERHTNFRY
jgi:predicted CXXCH cytochrome family protein